MGEEITLTREQIATLLYDNRPRDDNIEAWEHQSITPPGSSSGPSGSSHSSRSTPPPRAGTPKYVPPNKRASEPAVAYENDKGNPEDRKGVATGAMPGQPGSTFRVQPIPYVLTDAQFRYLKRSFPRTLFRATDDQNHDHPIAHTETMVATRHMQQKYPTGVKILDVYGSPNANDYYNQRQNTAGRKPTGRHMSSIVHCFTEKDYLRKATKWGTRNVTDLMGNVTERYKDADLRDVTDDAALAQWVGEHDHFQFVHTLYYMDLSLLAAILSPGASGEYKTFSAVIHRHALPEGKLFGGEVTYKKKAGVVCQTNRETGESYVHQDLSWIFESQNKVWRDARHAFTWSFHKVTDETWVITGSGCPNNMDERFNSYSKATGPSTAAHRMNQEDIMPRHEWAVEKYKIPGARSRMVGGKLVVQPGGSDIVFKVSNFEFIDYLRHQMAGKPRNNEQLASLMAIARREVEAGSRFPGSHSFVVPVDELHHHVAIAFVMDARAEVEVLSAIQSMSGLLRTHRALSSGDAAFNFSDSSSMVRTSVQAARLVHGVVSSKDTFDGILTAIEGHSK